MLLRFPPVLLGPVLAVAFLIPFSVLTLAQQNPAGDTSAERAGTAQSREHSLIAERFATERLAAWQQRLNLQDWNISVVVSHTSDLKPRTLGNIHWDADKKTAVIRVLDPSDYKIPFDDVLKDIEFTVVHELIHLELSPVLSPLQRNDANRREEEHAVNHMAEALLKLDRTHLSTPPAATATAPVHTAPAAH
jgi:hypothetical protein